jgi:hypothetical protein
VPAFPLQSLEMLISDAHMLEIPTAGRHEYFFSSMWLLSYFLYKYITLTERHGRAVSNRISYSGGSKFQISVLRSALLIHSVLFLSPSDQSPA